MDHNAMRLAQLAALERHLRNDEDSSVDTRCSSSLFDLDSSPEKATGRRRGDSFEGRCSTPPRLQRTNRKLLRRKRSVPRDYFPMGNSSPAAESPPREAKDTPGGGSRMGMSLLMSGPGQGDIAHKDTFSLSSDSSLDSDQELERKAEEIRAALRIQQLVEIAAVAERAAEAGHDSFTGLASTFGVDDGRAALRPLQMKRNNTYSEGFQPRRPLLRRTQTERQQERKIPVMALRHIDDLVPPMRILHLHLRSQLYRKGVETEKSLVDDPIEFGLLEGKQVDEEPSTKGSPSRTFIQRMTRWVATSSLPGELVEEKKSTDAGDEVLNSLSDSDASEVETGDQLCEQITSPEFASGNLKRSPLKFPVGLIPPEEQDFENEFTTPFRMKSLPPPQRNHKDQDKTDQRTIETAPTISSSENADPLPGLSPINLRPRQKDKRITPVALFDDDDDDEAAVAVDEDVYALGSRDYPKPFELMLQAEELSTPKPAEWDRDRTHSMDATSPGDLPNLFFTPVKLKGIRDRKSSHGRSSLMAGSFFRVDSFMSDPGAAFGGEAQRGNFAETEAEAANSESNLLIGFGYDHDEGAAVLKPRSKTLSQIIDAMKTGEKTQAAGESTSDPGDRSMMVPLTEPIDCDFSAEEIKTDQELRHEITLPRLVDGSTNQRQNQAKTTPTRNSMPTFETPNVTPKREDVTGEQSQELAFQASQTDVVQTPTHGDCRSCECLGLTQVPTLDSESSLQQPKLECKADTNLKQEPHTLPVAFRRVTSCPSLADTWDISDFDTKSPPTVSRAIETKQSILKVFERLSPKSRTTRDRIIYFSAKANHDYLHNYLYCGKPSEQTEQAPDPPIRPFCADPCETRVSCDGDDLGGCEFFSTAAETATFLFKRGSSGRGRDLLTFETASSRDYRDFHKSQETWFDAASEKFDGALERLVGSTRTNNNRRRKLFVAPTLHIKTPQSARKPRTNQIAENDPKKVKGIILVQQSRVRLPEDDVDAPGDEAFVSLYGVSRREFRSLTKEERLVLWQERLAIDGPQELPASMSLGGSPARRIYHANRGRSQDDSTSLRRSNRGW